MLFLFSKKNKYILRHFGIPVQKLRGKSKSYSLRAENDFKFFSPSPLAPHLETSGLEDARKI